MRVSVVSGGQTGVDRSALDVALALEMGCGGWCPCGRKSESGRIPERYPLRETPSRLYIQRTEWNVRDSDGTVIFRGRGRLAGGTAKTADFASLWNRPCLVLFEDAEPADRLRRFLENEGIARLNVAGPRASEDASVADWSRDILLKTFTGGTTRVGKSNQTEIPRRNKSWRRKQSKASRRPRAIFPRRTA